MYRELAPTFQCSVLGVGSHLLTNGAAVSSGCFSAAESYLVLSGQWQLCKSLADGAFFLSDVEDSHIFHVCAVHFRLLFFFFCSTPPTGE